MESVLASKASRGFESHPLRHQFPGSGNPLFLRFLGATLFPLPRTYTTYIEPGLAVFGRFSHGHVWASICSLVVVRGVKADFDRHSRSPSRGSERLTNAGDPSTHRQNFCDFVGLIGCLLNQRLHLRLSFGDLAAPDLSVPHKGY